MARYEHNIKGGRIPEGDGRTYDIIPGEIYVNKNNKTFFTPVLKHGDGWFGDYTNCWDDSKSRWMSQESLDSYFEGPLIPQDGWVDVGQATCKTFADGTKVSISRDGTMRIWNPQTDRKSFVHLNEVLGNMAYIEAKETLNPTF